MSFSLSIDALALVIDSYLHNKKEANKRFAGCAIKIVQIGVKEVVYSKSYGMDEMTAKVFAEANVKLRQHSPPSMQLEMQMDVAELDEVAAIEQLNCKSP